MSSGHRLRDVEQQHPLLDREEAPCSSHSEASTRLWFIQDCCGMVCAFITWYLVFFADFVVTFVMLLPSRSFWYAVVNGVIFNSLAVLALASHLRTMLTDPGAVPRGNATRKHMESLQLKPGEVVYKCPKCCSIKPERAHHCSICQRCIRKMDHHCPWVNNCVGEKNQRFFVLFTMYIAMISGHALALCGYHFITCIRVQWGECSDFSPPVTMLLLIFLCMEALLFLTFTAVMFSTQLHSICNDQTEIERLKNEKPTWGLVQAGPLTEPHPNITDQELFWGSDQYDFAVGLRASGMECFWHFAHRGETFYLNFMVQWVTGVGHDRHLSVHVNAPSGLLEANVDDAQGQINFEAKETGFYQMCFSNFHNRFGTMQIFLSFGVYYDSFQDPSERREEEKKKKEEVSKDLNDTLSIIEAACHKVENQVFHMFRFYGFSRMRKSADYYLLRSNSQYISWWSTALSLLIVTSGYLQLLFLKRLFVTKTGNEEEKPRC